MARMPRVGRAASILMLCLLAVSPLRATTFVPLSFEQLVNASSTIVYGRVIEVRGQWSDDHRSIESVVTVDVLHGMKGSVPERMAFTMPGGQVGRYVNVIPGTPVFAPGDLAVVFLTSRGARLPIATGLTQGVYRVQREGASGDLRVVPPVIDTRGKILRGDPRRQPMALSAFADSVKHAGGSR